MLCPRVYFLYFLFIPLLIWSQIKTNEAGQSPVVELTLKNGMRICLRHSDREPGEVEFQLFALGGYASLPPQDRPASWLAADTTWESGLDQHSSDELACLLDDHAIDLKIHIDLFDRQIEATSPTSELAYCLRLVNLLLTHPQFKPEGLKEALANALSRMQKKEAAGDLTGREVFLDINMQHWKMLSPFTAKDLHSVKLEQTARLFKQFFSNPADFTFVLVGDFDAKAILPILEDSLGTLPMLPKQSWSSPPSPAFPEGITKKEFSGVTRYKASLTRLTFPMQAQAADLATLDLLCVILKRRFLSNLAHCECAHKSLHVNYELPLFPRLDPVWLVIQFSSPTTEVTPMGQAVLKILEGIKQKGISEKEVTLAFQEVERNRQTFIDNTSELLSLANTYKMKGSVENLYKPTFKDKEEKEVLKKILNCYPPLDQYSIISLHP